MITRILDGQGLVTNTGHAVREITKVSICLHG